MKIYKKKLIFIKNVIKNIKLIKAKKIKIIDLRKNKNIIFNFIIICEGLSNLHIKTIYNKIIISIYKLYKINPYNIEGVINNEWILIDYNFLIINIFLKKIRKFYNLDDLFKKYPLLKYKI
ncbi:MAG: ribosome silencing factor [Candidatus Shikimatogenerans sp. JK-2022]|nr:ribosome silencing factor [Candidatus Shikimatogenerans bostrichidophilus]